MEYNAELEEKKYYYTRDELRRFLETIQHNDMAHRLLSITGARKGKLYALHWSEDFRNKSISLKKTLIHTNGKKQLQIMKTKASRRVVSVDDENSDVLKEMA